MRKIKLLQCLGVIASNVALFDGGYAGATGNLGFCVYNSVAPTQDETFVFTQTPGTQCMYPDGDDSCDGGKCTFPKQEKTVIVKIPVPANQAGLVCVDKDDHGQVWHFERDLTPTCDTRNSVMHMSVHSTERPERSLAFSLGTNGSGWWWTLFGDDYWNSQKLPLSTLQLSSTSALSGTNEIYCPYGWCTSGESPGSTLYIIYSPDFYLENPAQAMIALPNTMTSQAVAKFAQEAKENQVR
ncbi:hypothetical protein [Caedibacter taeniospiralis]|uniref:hypothetical protein n=1 Tax=Caedibacter taeniospiralis TaxID=28907 RepID=UPI000C2713DF|nr:hypothetical protein [Caedibacter taeniospiralis]